MSGKSTDTCAGQLLAAFRDRVRVDPDRFHPSLARLEVGCAVARRDENCYCSAAQREVGSCPHGRVIGRVRSIDLAGGGEHAIICWPAPDHPWARAPQGWRGQAFTLTALMVIDDAATADRRPSHPAPAAWSCMLPQPVSGPRRWEVVEQRRQARIAALAALGGAARLHGLSTEELVARTSIVDGGGSR